jgi:hypothetical protein
MDTNCNDDDISQPWLMQQATARGPVKIIASLSTTQFNDITPGTQLEAAAFIDR